MSEYQYYEFQALDRSLSPEEQEQLRAISTRARITATSFTNTYNWGDLSANPRRMVERYFDAHLYVTNWGTHRLLLRLPKQALALPTVKPYCLDHHVDAWTTRTHLLLDLTSEDEGGDWIEGADDSLAALIGVRDELANGDLRPLYLAWLSALAAWELEDDDEEEYQTCPEPPIPAGLGELTAPQQHALAGFLRLDGDLLAVAAQASPAAPKTSARPTKKELAPLIAALPQREKDALLLRLALGPEPRLRTELLHRLRGTTAPATVPGHRSAAQLLDAAHTRRTERRQRTRGFRNRRDHPRSERHQPRPPLHPHRGANAQVSAVCTTSHVLWLLPGAHRDTLCFRRSDRSYGLPMALPLVVRCALCRGTLLTLLVASPQADMAFSTWTHPARSVPEGVNSSKRPSRSATKPSSILENCAREIIGSAGFRRPAESRQHTLRSLLNRDGLTDAPHSRARITTLAAGASGLPYAYASSHTEAEFPGPRHRRSVCFPTAWPLLRQARRRYRWTGRLRHSGDMNRYAAAKPYTRPTALAELDGPTAGTVTLPRHLDWGPRYVYDLADHADVVLMYERVIREAQTPADLQTYLNDTLLRQLWADLFLPLPVRSAWQARFPELATKAAAA